MYVLIVFLPVPGPDTSPIGLDVNIGVILMCLCIWSSDVAFYGHQLLLGRFFGQPSGDNTQFSKNKRTQQKHAKAKSSIRVKSLHIMNIFNV